MNKTVIECNGIAAGYVKGLNILQGIDMIINEKEIVSIIGPNGAGKSTLLKAIMGIINILNFYLQPSSLNLKLHLLEYLTDSHILQNIYISYFRFL